MPLCGCLGEGAEACAVVALFRLPAVVCPDDKGLLIGEDIATHQKAGIIVKAKEIG